MKNLNTQLAHFSYLFQEAVDGELGCAEFKDKFASTFAWIAFHKFP